MAKQYFTDGSVLDLTLEDPIHLAYLQKLVGGLIEFVHFKDGSALMVNENGKINRMEHNHRATELIWKHGSTDFIVGPAVHFSAEEMKLIK